jgi:L-2-hydroxyglutarate oxidase LhgO
VYDLAVIGAGIVGLATAFEMLGRRPGLDVVLVDKEDRVAAHQTGRNSGVIHAGLYYRPGSLKATTCRRGVELLLRFCEEHAVRHELCGKVVVATSAAEASRLEELQRRGTANGVPGLERIGPARLREIEPHAAGVDALVSPSTGIVDFGEVARAIAGAVTLRGASIRFGATVRGFAREPGGVVVETTAGAFAAKQVVACAGLHADRIARLDGASPRTRLVPFRGEYFVLAPASAGLVRGLIYPVPDPRFPFLGVHFTRKIDGSVEAGPNAVLALAREGYAKTDLNLVDAWQTVAAPGFWRMARRHWRIGLEEVIRSHSRELFARALRRLVPEIRAEHLLPGGAGVRAQALAADGSLLDDFVIEPRGRVVHVLNAPSPAATACFAVGERVADVLCGEG